MYPPTPTSPPPPPPPWGFTPKKWDWRQPARAVAIGFAVLFAALIAIANIPFLNSITTSAQSGRIPQTEWRWESGTCDEWGYSGRIYNQGSSNLSGRLWAIAFRNNKEVDRDYAVVISLPPGESVGISFNWGAGAAPGKCVLDSFDR